MALAHTCCKVPHTSFHCYRALPVLSLKAGLETEQLDHNMTQNKLFTKPYWLLVAVLHPVHLCITAVLRAKAAASSTVHQAILKDAAPCYQVGEGSNPGVRSEQEVHECHCLCAAVQQQHRKWCHNPVSSFETQLTTQQRAVCEGGS